MSASPAVVVQPIARLSFPTADGGVNPTPRLHFERSSASEVAPLLAAAHYLGPVRGCKYAFSGWVDDELVTCMVFRQPTARMLPADGTWLELSRWCLTPKAGKNAGSRMMRWVASQLRRLAPNVTTLVSYSDPSVGHDGALYRSCGWVWAPTWHRLSPPPSGNGSWGGVTPSSVKDRWLFELRPSHNAQPDAATNPQQFGGYPATGGAS